MRVDALSGGQRKRASIAVELLARPHVIFLDEPTSGLDPATDAEMVAVLRRLSQNGTTVVFTTHASQDVAAADRVIFLARGGRLAFNGAPEQALRFFEVGSVEAIYARLAEEVPQESARRFNQTQLAGEPELSLHEATPPEPLGRPGPLRQWVVLTGRTYQTLVRNRLTLAILLGSPVMVVAMFAILFRPGAFDPVHPSPSTIAMIIFWVTFGTFLFGLTYGLLQICTERAIVRREHFVGMRLGPYLFSKLAVLLPFLLIVDVAMLAVLRALDRLPAMGIGTYAWVGGTLALDAAAALALGLLTSAAVSTPSQATLALPMLCFPAVLFSGAILPVHLMAPVGAAIATVMPDRWAFEAVGHDFAVRHLLSHGSSPLGPPLIASYGSAGLHSTLTYWGYLLFFVVVFLGGAWLVLRIRLRRSTR